MPQPAIRYLGLQLPGLLGYGGCFMRIVSHTCSNTEIVCALGCAELLVGVDEHSDYPVEVVSSLPKVGADLDLDVDAVKALQPDLVLTSLTLPGHERVVERLQAAGLETLICDPRSLDEVADDFVRIGSALGVARRGNALAADFRSAMQSDQDPSAERPALLLEWWPKPVIVPGRDSWTTELIELAGGQNPWADEAVKSRPVSDDEVAQADPDAVIMSWCGVKEDKYHARVVYRRKAWSGVAAIRNGQVHGISEALLGRPGPRLVKGLAVLRDIVDQLHTAD